MKGYMYILECSDGSYYTGSTKDLELRLQQHENGEGAKHTRKRLPVKLVYFEEFNRIDDAYYREKQVQGWNREKKEALIKKDLDKLHELAECKNNTHYKHADTEHSLRLRSGSTPPPPAERSRSQHGDVPELRFPEFGGEWDQNKIGDVFYVNAGGDIDKNHVSQEKSDIFQYPIYANASENKGFYAYSDIHKVEPPVITVAGRGVYIGIAHARNHKFYPIVRLLILKPKEKQHIYFFEYRINMVNLFVESTGVPQLTAPQISNYKIKYPSLPEQTRIATFLTTVDKRINLLQKKKAELEQYKKGVMQKLFSQAIRFKPAPSGAEGDGNDFADWEEKKLGDLGDFIGGGTPDSNNEEYWEGNIPWISSSDISSDSVQNINISRFITEKAILESATKIIPIDSVLIVSRVGIGKFAITKQALCTSQDFTSLITTENSLFLSYYFKYNSTFFIRLSQGTSIKGFTGKDIKTARFYFPSLPEQQKIANFLSSIDQSIEKVASATLSLQQWKQGLLQKMFV